MPIDFSFLPNQKEKEDKADLSFLPDKKTKEIDLSFLPDQPKGKVDLSFLPDKKPSFLKKQLGREAKYIKGRLDIGEQLAEAVNIFGLPRQISPEIFPKIRDIVPEKVKPFIPPPPAETAIKMATVGLGYVYERPGNIVRSAVAEAQTKSLNPVNLFKAGIKGATLESRVTGKDIVENMGLNIKHPVLKLGLEVFYDIATEPVILTGLAGSALARRGALKKIEKEMATRLFTGKYTKTIKQAENLSKSFIKESGANKFFSKTQFNAKELKRIAERYESIGKIKREMAVKGLPKLPQPTQIIEPQAIIGKPPSILKAKNEAQMEILQKTGMTPEKQGQYILDTVKDGAKLGKYADDVIDGKLTTIEASKKVIADAEKLEEVSKEIKPLLVEAKKYKTAEEFVDAQSIVYHGTKAVFDVFDPSKKGFYTGSPSAKLGFFFAGNKKTAQHYAGKFPLSFVPQQKQLGFDIEKKLNEKGLKNVINYGYGEGLLFGKWPDVKEGATTKEIKENLIKRMTEDFEVKVEKANKYIKKNPEDLKRIEKNIKESRKAIEIIKSMIEESVELTAKETIGEVKEVSLDMKNPKIYDDKGFRGNVSFAERIKLAIKEGHDGIIIKNTQDPSLTDVYIVFNPSQIKTKSQLIDIWNKAQAKPAVSSQEIVEQAGGTYRGIQKAEGEPNHVVFNDPKTDSTIYLHEEGLTTEKVKSAIVAKQKEFELKAGEVFPPKPPLTGTGSMPHGIPPDKPINSTSLNDEYESLKDSWIGEKDWQQQKAYVESARLQEKIKTSTGEKKFRIKSKKIDKAIQIYIDLKRKPDHYLKYFDKLTHPQKELVKLSQSLTPSQVEIANEISRQYEYIGLKSKEADVIKNTIDNYVNRVWDLGETKVVREQLRKFGTTTRHTKARKFETILEGWANKYKLKVESATNNLSILKEEMNNVIQDKQLLKQLSTMKNLDGDPILSTSQMPGYKRIEHPNFRVWRFAGKSKEADLKGRNFLQTPEGTILERRELYAPQKIAKNLNNILGVSKIRGIKAIDEITKFNAIVKAWVLQSSLFHHLAFMRSFYLGGKPLVGVIQQIKSGENFMKAIGQLTPRQAYRSGLKAVMDLTPEVELLVRNGLTLGKIQDWEESILRNEDNFIERILNKNNATKEIKNKIKMFRQNQADFLFKHFGMGLKTKTALIELRSLLKKHPELEPNKAAKIVANLMNDDFGGLHLGRMGRKPTVQHIGRIFALAPDWTESNIRSMIGSFSKGTEGNVYRHFWARIITKAMLATLAINALLHGKKSAERYIEAWNEGNLRWLDVDITPIYKVFGGQTNAKKYFSVLGHFRDPLKFALYPIKSAHYKGSIVYSMIFEAITGEDWAGREFTELPELLATGKTVRPSFSFVGRPNKYLQIPSYLISQIKGMQPIQFQQLLNWWAGESEGFDAIGVSLGMGIRTTYEPTEEQKAKQKEARKAIRKIHRKDYSSVIRPIKPIKGIKR